MAQTTNGASSATHLIKSQLRGPFDLDDSQILDKVYITHLHDDEKCDTETLFNIVTNVLIKNGRAAAPVTGYQQPDFSTLKLISCQMIKTPKEEKYVHQTTMWILQHLKTYSWDAKAVISVAAFALEYGNLVYLKEVHQSNITDQVANSLKQLNQVESRNISIEASKLVNVVMEAVHHVTEWAKWSSNGYDTEDVPSLSLALQQIPFVVYWTLASLVACTANIVVASDYELSKFREKLYSFDENLNRHLISSREEIAGVEEYERRWKRFYNPKDVVELLKFLVHRPGTPLPQLYDGTSKTKSDIDILRDKHVLLFISSLDKIEDEIQLLNSIYARLEEKPNDVVKSFRKGDFQILWIPIVRDEWEDEHKRKFTRLKNHNIKWYALEQFTTLEDARLIRERLNYQGKPIVTVLDPFGHILNEDAMDLIFQWGIDAFPFRKEDGDELFKKWKWFWDVTRKVNLGIPEVKGDRYIFIYGGGDSKWINNFTLALDKLRRHETITGIDAIIERYQLGKTEPKLVPRFWIEIESKKLKKHEGALDCEIQRIVKSLLCLKQDPQGWVILTKGYNVKVLGHGEPMYRTVEEFEKWQSKVLEKEGFDIAFKEYYDMKLQEFEALQPCSVVNVDDYNANVIATITCPNPTCGRVMEVTSVNYKCCHRDA
ncbi:Sieve element occlusion [Stylosanthes scabra]|uniref:Sieve element occlusion n=1 Tax=Stylosanthes scabra TaxID=79078 RepID=A0ABU6XET2_9FABA|nr:Sieve element occlusion [Stylosanthes scabra]